MAEYQFPVTLGRDFAGVVEQTGADVSQYAAGDAVYGFVLHANPIVHEGSWADYAVVPQGLVARKPASVDAAQAGVAPVAGLTAVAAFDALELSPGESVLVVGATGGVGTFFVQLAAAAGAHVVAPALAEDRDYLRELGVTEILERDSDIAAQVHERFPDGVDALLDLISFTPDASMLKDGGRLVSPLGAAGDGPGRVNVMASGTTENLERLAALLDGGALRVHIQDTYPLERAGSALESLTGTHTQGKLAIAVAS